MPADRSDAGLHVQDPKSFNEEPAEMAGGGAPSAERYGGFAHDGVRGGNRRR